MKNHSAFLLFLSASLFSFSARPVHAAADTVIGQGKKVKMNYSLSADGKEVDSTAHKPTVEFTFGDPNLLAALQQNVKGLKAGDHKKFTLKPEEGFGKPNPKALIEIPLANFHNAKITKGMTFRTAGKNGAPVIGVIQEVRKDKVLIDFNHPLAGKTVTFDVEILEVK